MVAVVADSAANVPPDLAGELRIGIVPMYLKFGARGYRDGVDLAPSDFYRRLAEDGEVASTSSPSPGEFTEAFERAAAAEIVCITVASGMSASHQQASIAAERFPGRVEVVDSRTASMAEGFVVLEAARAALRGASLDDVVDRARTVAGRTELVAAVQTFEFLRKSGRVTKFQAYAATMLDIKPVFRMRDGEIVPVARPRTRRRALERLVQETLSVAGERPIHLAVIHAAAERDALSVAERVSRSASVVDRVVTEVTPVIGAHTGPGIVGTAVFAE